jgi:DNA-binding MarR family transcriptional regulator
MNFQTLAYLRSQSKVTGSAHHLLLMLALYGEGDSDIARPSEARLARALGVSIRHVQRLLKTLVSQGAILKEPGGGRRTNRYYVVTPEELSTGKGG